MIRPAMLLATIAICGIAAAHHDSSWPLQTGNDAESYEAVATVSQLSQASILDEHATIEVYPRLIFHCSPGQGDRVHAKIDWQRFISSFNTDLSFQVDSEKRLWLKFGVDSSNKITLAKSGEDSSSLIEYVANASILTVGVTPYSESAVSVTYDLSGFSEAIEALRSKCAGSQ